MAKEIGNSLYGKTAQGVETMKARSDRGGGRRVFDTETGNMTTLPPSSITQPALAAFTTGLIRATLSEIISRLPRSRTVYTATTDGFLSDAPTSEIDLSGPAAKLFAELRRHVSESPDVVEVKHRVGRVLVTKTRGTITVEPGCLGKNGKAVLAKAGQRLEERYEDPWEECAAWEDLVRKRTFDTKGRHRAFIPLRPQWMNDADLVTQQRTARINLCYDLKRRPINVRDEKGIVAFDTEPWHSVEAFHTTRDAFEAWRASRRRVLRTSRDWKEFEEWKSSRRGRRESGVRGPRPRIVTLFMRAYARGELGLPGNAYKEAAEFLNEVGWKTTTTNIKDAKRRGQLILNSVTEFTPEELAFLEAVRKRWPAACLENLIVTPC